MDARGARVAQVGIPVVDKNKIDIQPEDYQVQAFDLGHQTKVGEK